jgi:cytochrome c biogenesis factor
MGINKKNIFMKKSMLAIVLFGVGITFVSAQKTETKKVEKTAEVETLQKADVQAETKTLDSMSAEPVDQLKTENMEMKKEEVKATEETLNLQKAKEESVE